MSDLSFAAPWLLGALALLPVLFFLLRLTPPSPRRQEFPGLRLLLALKSSETTPARTPWWLLLLRLAVAALAIIGLAGPIRNAPRVAAGGGQALVVLDNGWAAAHDWPRRVQAVRDWLARDFAPSAPATLLLTAPTPDGAPPQPGPRMRVRDLLARLGVLAPMPWPVDRKAAATALATAPAGARVLYVSDGLATPADPAFRAALARFGNITELAGASPPLLLRPVRAGPDRLHVRVSAPAPAAPVMLRAESGTGQVLAATRLVFAGRRAAEADLVLPAATRNRLALLRIAGRQSAGSVLLLDEGARRRPVGLLAQGSGANERLTGQLFYLRAALAGSTQLRGGTLPAMLKQGVALLFLADEPIGDPAERAALMRWVRGGGVLVRFAGPNLAAEPMPDDLLPVRLVGGDRTLDGAMSWTRPAALAPFPPHSIFAGLAVPNDVRVRRQVLAEPGDAPGHPGRQDWATLTDGTPLVTAAPMGAGWLVLFHVTANADWSNLPLSGLFPAMLHRLVALSAGLRVPNSRLALAPRLVLDGMGQLAAPGPAARGLASAAFASTVAGPTHPAGLYGPPDETRAFNLGAALPPLAPMAPLAGARLAGFDLTSHPVAYGPWLLAAALALLAFDLLLSLRLRGLRLAAISLTVGLVLLPGLPARAQAIPAMPSLATHLAYVITGDASVDATTLSGLKALSAFVNARTAATLSSPVGLDPGHDDMSFYPLIYWPILPDAPVPDGATIARLDDYMQNGGILLLDTRDADAPDPAADDALRAIGTALSLPALMPLTTAHVLTHTFYLLRRWPGRFAGGTVWVARDAERDNDGVSPVILGADDWAGEWAAAPADEAENNQGAGSQAEMSLRFGVNLVMYALTGNYKADQVHVPELLRRLGEAPPGAPSPIPPQPGAEPAGPPP